MTVVVYSGATLPTPYSCLKVGPFGPAGGSAERADLGCDASVDGDAAHLRAGGVAGLPPLLWAASRLLVLDRASPTTRRARGRRRPSPRGILRTRTPAPARRPAK